jgi:hypothetical protein
MNTKILASTLLAAGLLCGSTIQSLAQAAGRGPILSQEDRTAVMNSVRDEMTQLRADLQAAQKAAVEAALSKDATEADIQAKVEAVAKIQTKMAIAHCKAVKKNVKFTDEQTSQMKETPMRGYMTLFGGGFFGAGRRGGRAGGAAQQ